MLMGLLLIKRKKLAFMIWMSLIIFINRGFWLKIISNCRMILLIGRIFIIDRKLKMNDDDDDDNG
jgi:hypothetical protein